MKSIRLKKPIELKVGCDDRASELKAVWLRCIKVLRGLGLDVDVAKAITIVNNRRKITFEKQGERLRFKAYCKPGGPIPLVGKTGSILTRRIVVSQ